jgi:hypothetical protein
VALAQHMRKASHQRCRLRLDLPVLGNGAVD